MIMSILNDQVALVTGASRGIGLAIAQALAANGAIAVLNGRDQEALSQRVEEIRSDGNRAEAAVFDVTDENAVAAAVKSLVDRHGRIDILVNNAGVMRKLDVFETTLADWQSVVDTNLTAPFLCSKAALRTMREQKAGHIVMISSTAGQRGSPAGVASYSASKAGLIGLAHSLAYTAAQFDVTVNVVAPGMIETEMLRAGFGSGISGAAKNIPLGIGQPDDVAQAVLYLASEAGRYITGATIDVNGGLYVR
jgi:3-oxoacyl-[acyl-carrier protein] reductase